MSPFTLIVLCWGCMVTHGSLRYPPPSSPCFFTSRRPSHTPVRSSPGFAPPSASVGHVVRSFPFPPVRILPGATSTINEAQNFCCIVAWIVALMIVALILSHDVLPHNGSPHVVIKVPWHATETHWISLPRPPPDPDSFRRSRAPWLLLIFSSLLTTSVATPFPPLDVQMDYKTALTSPKDSKPPIGSSSSSLTKPLDTVKPDDDAFADSYKEWLGQKDSGGYDVEEDEPARFGTYVTDRRGRADLRGVDEA